MKIAATKTAIHDKAKMKTICQEPVPSIYCDGFEGVSFSQNSIKINLLDERMPGNEGELYRYLIARLIMPIDVFLGFVDALNKVKEEAIKSNLLSLAVEIGDDQQKN